MGVCTRWSGVFWGSAQLWRHLTISTDELEQPIGRSPSAPLIMFAEHQWEHEQRRLASWQAAKRAQLQRISHLAKSATFLGDRRRMQLSGQLPLLNSPVLCELELPLQLDEQEALSLAGLTQLTRLTAHIDRSTLIPVLPRLARLQRLALHGGNLNMQLGTALRSFAGLTHLVSALIYCRCRWVLEGSQAAKCASTVPLPKAVLACRSKKTHAGNTSALQELYLIYASGNCLSHLERLPQLRQLGVSMRNNDVIQLRQPASWASLETYCFSIASPAGPLQVSLQGTICELWPELLYCAACWLPLHACRRGGASAGLLRTLPWHRSCAPRLVPSLLCHVHPAG